uniref:Plastid lipid-associated protein/fibrillin conserved domain-containing protein n=2 Tax=Hemiselmis andersenii TaxID=464988 RepID=A0A6U5BKU0_HEMAN|mmetsp:Transcript_14238/g.32908  ORF Transcript_14238/g.32908 Transcript_14238/m.32908 type:complete len:287 (+) Transcript_14238:51-911(+)
MMRAVGAILLALFAGQGHCFLLGPWVPRDPSHTLAFTRIRRRDGGADPPPPFPLAPAAARPAGRAGCCWMSSAPASGEGREGVKSVLLSTLEGLDRGFSATGQQRKEVERIIEELIPMSPDPAPAETLLSENSKWELLYSDAPDIVGSGTGNGQGLNPSNGDIGQEFDAAEKTITNLVELKPPGLFSSLLPKDSLQLQVVIEARVLSPTRVGMNIKGTRAVPRNFAGVDVSRLPPLRLDLPVQPPFGEFEVLFYDGDLRVVRTGQGYVGVNRRVASEGAGAAVPSE